MGRWVLTGSNKVEQGQEDEMDVVWSDDDDAESMAIISQTLGGYLQPNYRASPAACLVCGSAGEYQRGEWYAYI